MASQYKFKPMHHAATGFRVWRRLSNGCLFRLRAAHPAVDETIQHRLTWGDQLTIDFVAFQLFQGCIRRQFGIFIADAPEKMAA